LTDRTSLSTLQGREWLTDGQFGDFLGHRISLQNCINEDLKCLNRESSYFGNNYDYIYIAIKTPTNNCNTADTTRQTTRGIILALDNSPEYMIAYKTTDAVIFSKNH
jgi:hypothetical protein